MPIFQILSNGPQLYDLDSFWQKLEVSFLSWNIHLCCLVGSESSPQESCHTIPRLVFWDVPWIAVVDFLRTDMLFVCLSFKVGAAVSMLEFGCAPNFQFLSFTAILCTIDTIVQFPVEFPVYMPLIFWTVASLPTNCFGLALGSKFPIVNLCFLLF